MVIVIPGYMIVANELMVLFPVLVKAAGVESEADTTTTGVCANLPNVYRMQSFI